MASRRENSESLKEFLVAFNKCAQGTLRVKKQLKRVINKLL